MRVVAERELVRDIEAWRGAEPEAEAGCLFLRVAGHTVRADARLGPFLRAMAHLAFPSSSPSPALGDLDLVAAEGILPQGWFCSANRALVGSRRNAVSAILDRLHRRCLVSLNGQPSVDELGKPLLFEWIHWLRDRSIDVLHAACLSQQDSERCLVLGGQGGSGKTTCVQAALLQGSWSMISDDYLALDESLTAWGLYSSLWTDPDGASTQPGPAGEVVGLAGKHLRLVQAASGGPGRPVAVVVPRTAAHSRLRRLSAQAALLAMAPSTLLLLPGDRQRRLARLARLTTELPCWELEVGREPSELVGLLEVCLEGGA